MAKWFGPKRFGYGIGPRSWQGWLATLLLVAALACAHIFLRSGPYALTHAHRAVLSIGLVCAYLLLVYLTCEKDAA